MTTEEKEVALAELAGFPANEIEYKLKATRKYCRKPYLADVADHGGGYFWRNGVTPKFKWLDAPDQLPNSQDLNILHAIALAQRGDVQTAMRPFLFGSCGQARVHIHTPDQFCEALLRAAKKWKD